MDSLLFTASLWKNIFEGQIQDFCSRTSMSEKPIKSKNFEKLELKEKLKKS
jgi:hypothetical protein